MNDDLSNYGHRMNAVKAAYAITETMAKDASSRPVFTTQFDKTVQLAEWLLIDDEDDDDDDDGDDGISPEPPTDFNGEEITPERLRDMVGAT